MNKYQYSEYKLNSLLNDKGYSVKKLINNGKFVTHIVFEDNNRERDVIGKVVSAYSKGEVLHWPRLHHQNLAPLLDVFSINAKVHIFISTYKEINLREIVHDEDFVSNRRCFANKKIYMENVLWGLDYLHTNSLVHLNISDANIYICLESNKAIITDFSRLTSICQAKKPKFSLPPFYQAPEVSEPDEVREKFQTFNPIAAEMWAFGVMALEVFLQHKVPWALVDYNCSRASKIMNYIDLYTLREANKGSVVLHEDSTSFKEFITSFLSYHPYDRCDARRAALSMFLKPSKQMTAQVILRTLNQKRNEQIKEKIKEDNFIRLNDLSPTKSYQIVSKNCIQQRNEHPDEKVTGDCSVVVNVLPSIKSLNISHTSDSGLTPKLSQLQTESSAKKTDINAGLSAYSSLEHLPVEHCYSTNESPLRTKVVPSIRKAHSSTYPNRKSSLHKQKFGKGLTQQISENIMSDIRSLRSINIQQKPNQSALFKQDIESIGSHRILASEFDRSRSESFCSSQKEESGEIQTNESSFLSLNNETNQQLNKVPSNEDLENVQLSQTQMYCSSTKSSYFESFESESYKTYISLRNLNTSKLNSNNRNNLSDSTVSAQSAPILGDLRSVSGIKKSAITASTHKIKRRKSKKSGKSLIQNENGQNEVHGQENQLTEKDSQPQNLKQNEVTDLRALAGQNDHFELTGKWKRLPQTSMVEDSKCIFRDRFYCPVHSKKRSSDHFQQNRETKEENSQSLKQAKKNMSLHLNKSGSLSQINSQISENTNPSHSRAQVSENNEIVNDDSGNRKCSKRYSYKRAVNRDSNLSDLISVDGFTLNRMQSVEKKRKTMMRRGFIRIEVVPQNCGKIQANDKQTMGTLARELKNEKTPKDSSKQRKVKGHKVKIGKKTDPLPYAEQNISQQRVISRRSVTILTVESPNNPKVPITQDPKVVLQKFRKIQANDKHTMSAVARKLQNEKTLKESTKEKKVEYHKAKIDQMASALPNAEQNTSQQTVISRRSTTILADESPNNPQVAETKDKRKEKRMSIKKAALYCMCIGEE